MYITKKTISGRDYYYLRKSVREDGKVKSKNIAYLGKNLEEARRKMKGIEAGAKKEKKPEEKPEKIEKKKPIKKKPAKLTVDDMTMFCKRRGFVYLSGEIYGGYSGFWDFGHVGVEMKNNIKKEWWNFHVKQREDVVGIDGSIITHPKTWEASGHTKSFSDIIVNCKKCKKVGKIDKSEMGKVKCECGGEYDSRGEFNLMFKTQVGPFEDESSEGYLRPETAQLIFTNFKFVQENARLKLPFGIAQIGKAFRNEISPRDFLFRSREFEQMEIEYFIDPEEQCGYKIPDVNVKVFSVEMQEKNKGPEIMKIKQALDKKIIKNKWHAYWLSMELKWFFDLDAKPENFRLRQHKKDELAHYSSDCWDIEYNFPFGWKELQGIADRGKYDLTQHEKFSEKDLKIFDEKKRKKILPSVVAEPSLGVERAFLVFMFDAYEYDNERENIVLHLNPKIAPIKAGIFPIVNKKQMNKLAEEVYSLLKEEFNVNYDKSGSVGRRYARNDEIGTPFCITIDGKSMKKKDVTIRNRDNTKQVRVKISELKEKLRDLIDGKIEFEKAGKIFKK